MATGSSDDFDKRWNIIMLGKSGSGKSRTGNSILGDRNAFVFDEPTADCKSKKGERFGKNIKVIDTPSDAIFFKGKISRISETISEDSTSDYIPVCLFCVQIGRFTAEDLKTYTEYAEYFDESLFQFSIVVFTNGDKWENDMIDKGIKAPEFSCYIDKLSDPSKVLLKKCGGRYVRFNNRIQGKESDVQVEKLFEVIEKMLQNSSKQAYQFQFSKNFKSVVNITKSVPLILHEKVSFAANKCKDVINAVGAYVFGPGDINGTVTKRESEVYKSE